MASYMLDFYIYVVKNNHLQKMREETLYIKRLSESNHFFKI